MLENVSAIFHGSLLFIPLYIMEYIYFGIYILCAVAVYLVLVRRIGDDLPRKTADQIFFLMLGMASVIWVLSKLAPTAV